MSSPDPLQNDERASRVESEPARRIVSAMRRSIGVRGVAGSTFDHVTREAGVARGAIHYYFGSKERLLVEVVDRDADLRIAAMEATLAGADSPEAVMEALARQLTLFLHEDPSAHTLIYELVAAAPREPPIRAALRRLYARWRTTLAAALREKERAGVVRLRGDPEIAACVMTAVGEGLVLQALADPERDLGPSLAEAGTMIRTMLGLPLKGGPGETAAPSENGERVASR